MKRMPLAADKTPGRIDVINAAALATLVVERLVRNIPTVSANCLKGGLIMEFTITRGIRHFLSLGLNRCCLS
jgi:hypothetical protein